MKRALTLLLFLAASAPAQAAGPPLTTPPDRLAAALTCPSSFPATAHEPVLLVHGTATNTEDSWAWNHSRTLPSLGFDVCSVDLPDRALGDIQVATEYVVHAVREIHARSGRRVDLIGHSQGTLEPRWAVKWWPDVRAAVDDLVLLAGPGHGVSSADGACTAGACAPAIWQMKQGSALLGALNRGDETPGDVSVSSIYSETDELVQPTSTAPLDGASNLRIQEPCPGRPVHHGGILADAVAFAWTRAALERPGPAPADAAGPALCAEPFMPGVTAADAFAGNDALYRNAAAALASYEQIPAEPPLAAYAQGEPEPDEAGAPPPAAARPALRLRLRPRAVHRGRRTVVALVTASGRAVRGARVTLGGRAARTDARGRARLVVRFRFAGRRSARATRTGMRAARATLRVRR